MKKQNTKRTLLMSALSLLLCVSMLVGTTFAWFTDSVTSGNNIIKSGNLDIELEYWNGTQWVDVSGKSDILTNTLWEPGVTEVAYLRVKNAGTLALKYQLGINIISEKAGVNAAGQEFLLSDYIQFGVVENVNGETGAYATREAAVDAVTDAKIISAGYNKAASMTAGQELYLALVVYMPTNVGNIANHNGENVPEINLGINVVATQFTYEEDSFGKDYDEEAEYPIVVSGAFNNDNGGSLKAGEVVLDIPGTAGNGDYTLNVANKSVTTNEAGETTVAFDINLLKNGVKVEADGTTKYQVKIEVGKNLDVTAVTHKGIAVDHFSYDPTVGVVVFKTDSFSPFAVVYSEADADSVYVPTAPEAAKKLEKENVVAVDENGNEYTTLKAAIDSGAAKLYLKEGADLGTITHLDVDHDLVIFGNGARITGGERDLAIDTYKHLTKDITVTIYNLHGVAFWGQRNTAYTANLNLYNCNDIGRIYINGTSGVNNIALYNCTASTGNAEAYKNLVGDTVVYSNANGVIHIEGCTFTNIGCPVNLNHKIAGEQTVNVIKNEFVDCSTMGDAAYYAPVRLYNSAEGANQTLTVSGNAFVYSEGKAPINGADVLLNAKHNGVDAVGTIAATVQTSAAATCGQNVTLTYAVYTAEDLFAIATEVNKVAEFEANIFKDQTIKLMCDIDLGGAEWSPIGNFGHTSKQFTGIFDGQNHVISNFKITQKTPDRPGKDRSPHGFFGNVNGTVKNLTIAKAVLDVKNAKFAGALVGRLNGGAIENCHVIDSSVTIYHWQVGGLIGQLNGGKVSGCSVIDTTVNGYAQVGGIVGVVLTTDAQVIENCVVKNVKLVQNGSFGANYDKMFGGILGATYSGTLTVELNNCAVVESNVTTLCGYVEEGGTLIIDGAPVVFTSKELIAAINAKKAKVYLANGEYALCFTNNTNFNVDGMTFIGMGDNVKLSVSSSEAWYGRVQGDKVTFENIHFTSDVGATGGATYNSCVFDSWAICAVNNVETYYNNCTINGCLNTSVDFNSGNVYVKNSTVAKTEYSFSSSASVMSFENCEIGELISWNANTVLTNCTVTTLDDTHMTTGTITRN